MPSIIHKIPIADELRESMPKHTVDLMLGSSEANSGILSTLYRLIGNMAGAIELAYRRGYEVGYEDGKKGNEEKII